MGGFFLTFIVLVVAMAWSQWLTTRVSWAPRVVYVGGVLWVLTLVYAGASFTSTDSMAAVDQSLTRIIQAAQLAQILAFGTLAAMIPLSAYAFTRPAVEPT